MTSNRDDVSTVPRPVPWRRAVLPPTALAWVLAPVLCLSLASHAFAYCGAQTAWLNFPQITVASDGNEYTGVTAIGYGWEGRVDIDCDGLARVKSWSLRPVLRVAGMDHLDFALYKQGKSYSVGKRPQSVERTVGSTFPDVFVDDYATQACNHHLQLLMSQGLSRAQVLREKRVLAADYWEQLDVDATIGDVLQQAHSYWHTEIVCDKSPFQPLPPGPGGITTDGDFVLDNARLVIVPSTYSGRCPKDLTLLMEVQGNHKGTVEARIESTEGWKSTLFVVQTHEFDGGSGLWGREFSEAFTVPVAKPQGGGGGGGGIPPGPGNFQAPSRPEDPVFPGSPKPQGPGGLTAKDPGPNVHKQSLRLVAQANGKTVYSDWKQFSVTCDPKGAIAPATTAFLPGGTGGDPPKPEDKDPKPGKPLPPPGQKPSLPSAGRADAAAEESADSRARTAPSLRKQSPAGKASVQSAEPQAVPGAGRRPPAAGARPDLRVLQARRNAQSPNVIEFLAANGGKGAAAKTRAQLTCERAEGGFESWSVALPAIAAAEERWIRTSPRQAKPVRTRVRGCEIRLDPGDTVAESDERNNGFSCAECRPGPARRR